MYLYQGEEIGLPNAEFDDLSTYRDIESLNAYKLLDGTHDDKMAVLSAHSRDNGRTPMPCKEAKAHY